MPPGHSFFQLENLTRHDMVEFCTRKADFDGKVADYVLTKLEDELKFTKQLLGKNAENESESQSKSKTVTPDVK